MQSEPNLSQDPNLGIRWERPRPNVNGQALVKEPLKAYRIRKSQVGPLTASGQTQPIEASPSPIKHNNSIIDDTNQKNRSVNGA